MAAAYLGRPRADGPRLPLLRGPAAGRAARHPGCLGRRGPSAPGGRRRPADRRSAVVHLARAVGDLAPRRVCDCARQRARGVPSHRVRAAPRHPHPGRDGLARQPGVAEDSGHRRGRERERAGAGGELPELRSSPAGRSTRCGTACASGSREERTLYDQLLGLALRLASQTLDQLQGPTAVYIEGASSAARAGGGGERHLRGHPAARCSAWSKRSSGWCGC